MDLPEGVANNCNDLARKLVDARAKLIDSWMAAAWLQCKPPAGPVLCYLEDFDKHWLSKATLGSPSQPLVVLMRSTALQWVSMCPATDPFSVMLLTELHDVNDNRGINFTLRFATSDMQ